MIQIYYDDTVDIPIKVHTCCVINERRLDDKYDPMIWDLALKTLSDLLFEIDQKSGDNIKKDHSRSRNVLNDKDEVGGKAVH